jgi:hypothetical protein
MRVQVAYYNGSGWVVLAQTTTITVTFT